MNCIDLKYIIAINLFIGNNWILNYQIFNNIRICNDMRVINTDAKSYWEKSPNRCMEEAEMSKKNIYLEACL